MNGEVEVKEEVKGDVLIIRMRGRLDAISSPKIEKKVFDHIHKDHSKLLFDFSGVDYLSSAGMRMLLSTAKKLKTSSGQLATGPGQLVLCEVNDNVMDVLKMSGFDHILDIAKTEEDALRRFQAKV